MYDLVLQNCKIVNENKIIESDIAIKNNRIDMTSFLNLCIKNKILSLKIKKYKKYWYEIDTISDFNFAQRELKKLFK